MDNITITKKLNVKRKYDVIVCGGGVAGVNISTLQSKLEKDNIMVHFPDEYVPEDKSVVVNGRNAAEIGSGHV